MVDFAPGSTGTDEVLFARDGVAGRVMLNRPRAINALTEAMVRAMLAQLEQWRTDDDVQIIVIQGAGERGLCAGGDVRAVREAHEAGTTGGIDFWKHEYDLDALIADYPKPVLAVMDGIVMGGGLGLSIFATHRIVTERSQIAMPETVIGFFPDVGATYLLSRAPGEVGTHIALTGQTIDGSDAIYVGFADRQVASDSFPVLLGAAAEGKALEGFGSVPPSSSLADDRAWIDECYASDDPVEILDRLRAHDSVRAAEAADLIEQRSPLSVAVTLAALRRAARASSVREVLDTDAIVSEHMLRDGDFSEGVRAQLVDKDKSPRWKHASLAEVPAELVESFFRPA